MQQLLDMMQVKTMVCHLKHSSDSKPTSVVATQIKAYTNKSALRLIIYMYALVTSHNTLLYTHSAVRNVVYYISYCVGSIKLLLGYLTPHDVIYYVNQHVMQL